MMEMPQLNEHHEQLAAMVGEWNGNETMHPSPWSPESASATSRTVARRELGGFFIITDYEQKRDGEVSYSGHGVFGWDPRKEKYTLHWYDTMGGDPGAPALGTWEGDTLCFQHQHHMGHSRYTYVFSGKDAYTFALDFSQDGREWVPFCDGKYTRA